MAWKDGISYSECHFEYNRSWFITSYLQYIMFMNVFRFAVKYVHLSVENRKLIILKNIIIYLIRRIENFFIPILKMSLNFNVFNPKFIFYFNIYFNIYSKRTKIVSQSCLFNIK